MVKNTKKNVAKLLAAMQNTNCSIFDATKKEEQPVLQREILTLGMAIDLLTRPNMFKLYAEIYPELWKEEEDSNG